MITAFSVYMVSLHANIRFFFLMLLCYHYIFPPPPTFSLPLFVLYSEKRIYLQLIPSIAHSIRISCVRHPAEHSLNPMRRAASDAGYERTEHYIIEKCLLTLCFWYY